MRMGGIIIREIENNQDHKTCFIFLGLHRVDLYIYMYDSRYHSLRLVLLCSVADGARLERPAACAAIVLLVLLCVVNHDISIPIFILQYSTTRRGLFLFIRA